MRIEDQIRDCAARKLGKIAAAAELGISVHKLAEMLSVMPPIEWLGANKSRGYLDGRKRRKRIEGEALKAQQAWRDKTHRTAFGVTASINDLAAKFSEFSGNAIRYRLKAGMSIEEALTTPKISPVRDKPIRNMFSK